MCADWILTRVTAVFAHVQKRCLPKEFASEMVCWTGDVVAMESCVVACVSQRANTRVVSLSKRHSTRGFERALWRVRRSPVWLINYSTLTLQHSDSALERERESVCSRFKVSSTLRLFVLGFKTRRAGERATPLLSYELCVWIRVVFAQADRLSTLP